MDINVFANKMLTPGMSTIITAQNGKFFVVANKGGKGFWKEVSSKEEGRAYIKALFGGNSKFMGAYKK